MSVSGTCCALGSWQHQIVKKPQCLVARLMNDGGRPAHLSTDTAHTPWHMHSASHRCSSCNETNHCTTVRRAVEFSLAWVTAGMASHYNISVFRPRGSSPTIGRFGLNRLSCLLCSSLHDVCKMHRHSNNEHSIACLRSLLDALRSGFAVEAYDSFDYPA